MLWLIEGWKAREEHRNERLAVHAAWLLSPYPKEGGDRVTPAELLGRPSADTAAQQAEDLATFIGAPSSVAYEDVMAHQQRIREGR